MTDGPPATDLLYLRDAYQRSCAATIMAIDNDRRAVLLDQTVFFAGGGGQPADTGHLTDDRGTSWEIVGCEREGGLVWHILGGGGEGPAKGTVVRAGIAWEPRYRLMRTHSALHVLCGVVFRDFGALVTGGNMGPDRARMDFELERTEFTPAWVATVEQRANDEIAAGRDIIVRSQPRAEALLIPDLIRTKINLLPAGITEIRTVEIVGLDLQADGGTHVANTREIGGLRVVGTRSKGKANKRLEIELTDGTSS